MDREEFNSIFCLIKNVRNKIRHSNVLFNYKNKSDQVILANNFLKKNNFAIKDLNRIRFFDLVNLIYIVSKKFDNKWLSLNLIAEKIKQIKLEANNLQILKKYLTLCIFMNS